ncbi:MAG TPA: hypothetical protein VJP06_05595 [Thermoplasmata archaeon]|nr:hypothetical protein [Thermoplasmata archaeon]
MNVERIRSILGVWTPMAIAVFIIVTSINFYFTAILSPDLESWRLVCSVGAFFVGGVMILSTYGRYKKTKEARAEAAPRPSLPATPASPPDREGHDDGDHDQGRH